MAVVEYQCDTCNRKIHLQRNIKGLETLKQCNITQNCVGHLQQTNVLENFVRGSLPVDVSGLSNQEFRKCVFDYVQKIARKEWKIEHKLGNVPIASVYDVAGVLLTEYTITVVDSNNIILTFNEATSGSAQLIVNNTSVVQPQVNTITQNLYQQLTYSGNMVVATTMRDALLTLVIEFTNTDGTTFTHSYDLDLTNNDDSWSDFNNVVIKSKQYIVRSFNSFFDDSLNGKTFRFKSISNGNSNQDVYFDAQDRPLNNTNNALNNIFILLSGKSRSFCDKISNKVIDCSSVTKTNNQFEFIITNREFLSSEKVIQDVYPPVRSI